MYTASHFEKNHTVVVACGFVGAECDSVRDLCKDVVEKCGTLGVGR